MGFFNRIFSPPPESPNITVSFEISGSIDEVGPQFRELDSWVDSRYGGDPLSSGQTTPATVCPYCGSVFDAELTRSKKCPECKEPITVRKLADGRVAMRSDLASASDEYRSRMADFHKAFARVLRFDLMAKDFIQVMDELGLGYSARDGSWRLLNSASMAAIQKGDFNQLTHVYSTMADQLHDEGRDAYKQLELARECEAADLAKRFPQAGVEIVACTCEVCDVDNRKKLTWSEFAPGQVGLAGPLPHSACVKGHCSCHYGEITPVSITSKPGFYRGRHFTAYPDEVRDLRRAGKDEEAERLLLELANAVEAESKTPGGIGMAPWYYEQLAIIYRKRKDYGAEIAILQRYQDAAGPVNDGSLPFADRVQKAIELKQKADAEAVPE